MIGSRLLGTAIVAIFACVRLVAADLPDGVKVGDAAPDFNIKNIDGSRVGLATFRDAKGIILVFTCNHCPYSQKYEQRIINLHKSYESKGWPVLAVNPNDSTVVPEDSFSEMQKLAKEKEYKFPYALDETQSMAMKYGARRTPHVFLLKKTTSGFTVAYIGSIDDNARDQSKVENRFVVDALEQLLKDEPVTTSTTKAIGCTIKWRPE